MLRRGVLRAPALSRRVIARPSFSKHEEAWEKLRQVPVGTFRRYAEVEGGAIQSVLDGEIGTTEGGARLLQELHEDGVVGCETLTPMDLTHQIRKILEAGRVQPELHEVLRRLRFEGLYTGLLCHQWSHAGRSISTPELLRTKANVQRYFNTIVECKEEKLNRLDPSLYALTAQRISTQPQELIYVDCREHHLEPAAAIGMTTVHMVTPEATVTALENFLQMPLRASAAADGPHAGNSEERTSAHSQPHVESMQISLN